MAQRHMNVEIGAEAALFPEKEDINGIAVAVWLEDISLYYSITMVVYCTTYVHCE